MFQFKFSILCCSFCYGIQEYKSLVITSLFFRFVLTKDDRFHVSYKEGEMIKQSVDRTVQNDSGDELQEGAGEYFGLTKVLIIV